MSQISGVEYIKVLEGQTVSGLNRKRIIIDLSSIKSEKGVSAEEIMEDEKVQDELELVLKKVLDKIEFSMVVENSGIGAFQFGSSNEVDKGVDYLTIEKEDTLVQALLILGEVSSLAARLLLINSCLITRDIRHERLILCVKFTPILSYESRVFLSYKINIGCE